MIGLPIGTIEGSVLELAIRFIGPLTSMASVPALYSLHPLAPILLIVALPSMLLVAEAMPQTRGSKSASHGLNRLAVWLTIMAAFAVIGWGAAMKLTDADRRAIAVYVKSLPPLFGAAMENP